MLVLSTVRGSAFRGCCCSLNQCSAWRCFSSWWNGMICRWAVGILLFEMLAGFPPFYDDNPFLIYQRVLSGRMDFPFHFDRDAKVSCYEARQPLLLPRLLRATWPTHFPALAQTKAKLVIIVVPLFSTY